MQKNKKEMIGLVLRDKMDKTIVVQVGRQTTHPIFKKAIKLYSKFKAHDENNEAKSGDVVKVRSTRPLSREKRWRLVKIVKKAS